MCHIFSCSKSMGNLGSEEDFHDAKDMLTPKMSRTSMEGLPDGGNASRG